MNKFFLMVLVTVVFCPLLIADSVKIYRDASTLFQRRSSSGGNRRVYRDSSGQARGTASVSGNRKVYRDGAGQIIVTVHGGK